MAAWIEFDQSFFLSLRWRTDPSIPNASSVEGDGCCQAKGSLYPDMWTNYHPHTIMPKLSPSSTHNYEFLTSQENCVKIWF